jgi:hypothetical protein
LAGFNHPGVFLGPDDGVLGGRSGLRGLREPEGNWKVTRKTVFMSQPGEPINLRLDLIVRPFYLTIIRKFMIKYYINKTFKQGGDNGE